MPCRDIYLPETVVESDLESCRNLGRLSALWAVVFLTNAFLWNSVRSDFVHPSTCQVGFYANTRALWPFVEKHFRLTWSFLPLFVFAMTWESLGSRLYNFQNFIFLFVYVFAQRFVLKLSRFQHDTPLLLLDTEKQDRKKNSLNFWKVGQEFGLIAFSLYEKIGASASI